MLTAHGIESKMKQKYKLHVHGFFVVRLCQDVAGNKQMRRDTPFRTTMSHPSMDLGRLRSQDRVSNPRPVWPSKVGSDKHETHQKSAYGKGFSNYYDVLYRTKVIKIRWDYQKNSGSGDPDQKREIANI